MSEVLLTQAQVAEMLGVSAAWVYKESKKGVLPHFRLAGGPVRFRQSEVEEWLEEQRRGWTPGRRTG